MRLIVQAEQETLRVHERMSRVGSMLSACCLLDTDAVTAGHWLTSDDDGARRGSRDRDEMMRDIGDKFSRLRVSPSLAYLLDT